MIIDKNLLKVMIDKNLLKEFEDFCKLNGVDPVKKAHEILRNELNIMKYGTSPIDNIKRENSIQEVNDNEEKKPVKKKPGRPKKIKSEERVDSGGTTDKESIKHTEEEKQTEGNVVKRKIRIIKKK